MRKVVAAAVLFVSGAALLAAAVVGSRDAVALAPCVEHQNTAEELHFLQLLQAWRDEKIPGSLPLSRSAQLNAAATGYAQFLADRPGAGGHYADGGAVGRAWADRAIQCGYPVSLAGGGEGVAIAEPAPAGGLDAQGALAMMAANPGSGIYVPANIGVPVRCVGVAKATSADGRKVAWVTLVFAGSSPCPGETSATATPVVPTATPTASPTPTRTPSPTPTPTQPPAQSFEVRLPAVACDSCGGH